MALRKKPPTTLLLTDMSSLYGYIYCMLISEGLSGMPLYGGALYMIGRVTTVFAQTFSPEEAIQPTITAETRTSVYMRWATFICPRRCDGCAFR